MNYETFKGMLDLTQLKPQDLRALPREKTWFFLSIGTVEDHGPHLPIGMDLLEGDAILSALFQKMKDSDPEIQGVKLPTIPLAIESNTPHLAIVHRPHVVRDYLVDLSNSLYKEGFLYLAVYSGTFGPRQLTAIEEAGQFVRRKHQRRLSKKKIPVILSLSSTDLDPETDSRSLLFLDPAEHGGKRDTSVARKFFPKLVGPIPPEVGHPPDLTFIQRLVGISKSSYPSFWGGPEKADADLAGQRTDDKVRSWVPKMLATTQGASSFGLFRSKFSWLPVNHSLLRVYILCAMLFLFFLGWIYFVLRTMTAGF